MRWILCSLLLFLGLGAAHAQKPAPAVAAPADAEVIERAHEDFATYPLIVEPIRQRGGIRGNISATLTVEGDLTRITYRLDAESSAGTIIEAYTQRLAEAGFEPLFECEGQACGPTFRRVAPGYSQSPAHFDVAPAAQHYQALRRARDGGGIYAAVQIVQAEGAEAPVFVQVDTLRVEPRVVGAISVSATEMARQLDTQGRVALYGLYFATDSAEIKPESRGTLAEIAKLLANRPSLRLLVVGHTDSRGSFDYNIDLSKRRAAAVVDTLVEDYGVAAERLKPWGVGYSAPRESNAGDIGRAKNRRVELVIW